jgi:SAM-dependent methyltransferase
MNDRLRRLLRDPLGVLARRARLLLLHLRFGGMDPRRAERFWTERHARYGADDLRGVGLESWSHEENLRDCEAAGRVVLEAAKGVALERARVLEIGFGTGFYTGCLRAAGVRDYTGVDLAPNLLPALRARHPGFRFEQADITRQAPPGGPYDLVLMIDVTQHLVAAGGFEAAMAHVRASLAPGALFLVTSWLRGPETLSFFEVARPLSAYVAQFPPPRYRIASPRPCRQKYLLAIEHVP